jgi:hypothetical protein
MVRRLRGEDLVHEDSKEWQEMEKAELKTWINDEKQMGDSVGDEPGEEVMHEEEEGMDEEMGNGDEEEWNGGGEDDEDGQGDAESDNEDNDNDINEGSSASHALDDSDNHSVAWSQEPELSTERNFDISRAQCKETDNMYSFYEHHTYDPTKLTRDDVQWVDRCRVLAFNEEFEGEKKAFISSRGRSSEYFDFEIKSPSNMDPRDDGRRTRPCYHVYEPEIDGLPSFPFHEACFKIMLRSFGYEGKHEVDKDVLYAVMSQNMVYLAKNLEVDYGPIRGPEQFWECYQGEEWSVMDPGPRPGAEDVVQSMLPAQLFSTVPMTSDLSHKVRSDPLTMLPYDVLHGIFANLSVQDALSLIKASWHVLESTRDPAFWRLMIRLHIVPFFWELNGLLERSAFPSTFDWRGMFQWLDEITKAKFGMNGPLGAIANRRRIWDVCQQLYSLYHDKMSNETHIEPSDAEAKSILDTAVCLHKPIMNYPPPLETEARTISTQFIRSWNEIAYRACDFETYWSPDGNSGGLTGISVAFGSAERLFGSKGSTKGQSLRIEAGEWIKEIRLLMGKFALPSEYSGESTITKKDDPMGIRESQISGMVVSCLQS